MNVSYPVKYTKDWEEKTRRLQCGKLISKDGKTSIKLDTIPVEFNGRFNVFEQDEKEEKKKDDMPF